MSKKLVVAMEISNLDFDGNVYSFIYHAYGTLLEKRLAHLPFTSKVAVSSPMQWELPQCDSNPVLMRKE